MAMRLAVLTCVFLVLVTFSASAASAEKFVFGQHAKQMAEYDANLAKLAVISAEKGKIAADAMAAQDLKCKAVGMIPGVGSAMRFYNQGEMKAMSLGKKRVQLYAVMHTFFKWPSSMPEHAVTDFLWQLRSKTNWRELDPITVFLVANRPYWMDFGVTGAKIFFGLAGSGALSGGHHVVTKVHHAKHIKYLRHCRHFKHFHHFCHFHHHHLHKLVQVSYVPGQMLPHLGNVGPVAEGFLWMAAGGGGSSVVSGTVHELYNKLSPFRQYYKDFEWWTGEKPTFNL